MRASGFGVGRTERVTGLAAAVGEYPTRVARVAHPATRRADAGTVDSRSVSVYSMPSSRLPAIIEQPSPVLDPDALRVDTSHQLPPHRDKLGRVTDHVTALTTDLKVWTELQIALVQRKIEGIVGIFERFQHLIPALKLYIPAALIVLIGLLFLLVTVGLGLGALVGSMWLGFGILTLTLFAVGGLLGFLGWRRQQATEAIVAKIKEAQKQESTATRDAVAATERLSARQSTV